MIQRVERGEPIQKWVPTYRLYELCARERGTLTLLHLFRPHSFGLPAPVYMNWHPFSPSSPPPPPTLSLALSLSHCKRPEGHFEKSNCPKNFEHDERRRPVNHLLRNYMSDYLRDTQYVETNNVTCGDPSLSSTAPLKQPVNRSSSIVNVHRRVRANGRASERSSKTAYEYFHVPLTGSYGEGGVLENAGSIS